MKTIINSKNLYSFKDSELENYVWDGTLSLELRKKILEELTDRYYNYGLSEGRALEV